MFKKILQLGCLGVILFGWPLPAYAVTITFDDLENPVTASGVRLDSQIGYIDGSYVSQGFQFSSSDADSLFAFWRNDHPYYNSSAALINAHPNQWTILSSLDNDLFSVRSIDLDTAYTIGAASVHFYAFNTLDQLVAELAADLLTDGWITVNFNSAFNNISYLKWQQVANYHHFDNVNVFYPDDNSTLTEVSAAHMPEPASMILFGSGLLGLLGYKRRK